jgi:hypothetical protein
VPEDSTLLRFLRPEHVPTTPGQTRPNSDLFKPSSDGSGTSVIVVLGDEEIAAAKGRHPEVQYWVRIPALVVRGLELEVVWDNYEEGDDPQHGAIVGWPSSKGQIAKLRTELVKRCIWDGAEPPTVEA